MSKQKHHNLDDKIEIFKRYFESGNSDKDLNGNTVFEGYPIGQWAIQIRSNYYKNNRYFSDAQFEFLDNNGILKKRIGLKIDEKIDELIRWKSEYPDIKISYLTDTYIKQYLAENNDMDEKEKEELLKRYKKIQSYYEYVNQRTYTKKLKARHLYKLKQANFSDKYGYSDEIDELALKYRIAPASVKKIIDEYGTMRKYINFCRKNLIVPNEVVNIDFENRFYDQLFIALRRSENDKFYSGDRLKEAIEELPVKQAKVLSYRFGLEDGMPLTLEKTGKKLGMTAVYIKELVRQQEVKALRKLRTPIIYDKIVPTLDEEAIDDIYKSNAIFSPDDQYSNIPRDLDSTSLMVEFEKRKAKYEDALDGEKKDKDLDIPIEELAFSIRTYNCLKRSRINNLNDLVKVYSEGRLDSIRKINLSGNNEIIDKLKSLGLVAKEGEVTEEDKELTSLDRVKLKRDELRKKSESKKGQIVEAKKLLEGFEQLEASQNIDAPDFED